MLAPVQTVAPTAYPVDLEALRAHLRLLDDTDEDATIESYRDAAVAYLDGYTGILGRAIMPQTWRQDYPGFCSPLRLPLGPVSAVTGVTYYDAGNTQRTLAASVYRLLTDARGPYVTLKPDQVWPTAYGREDAVSITFTAGAEAAPVPIQQAIKLMVGHWFANREPVIIGETIASLPMAVEALLANYRRVGV